MRRLMRARRRLTLLLTGAVLPSVLNGCWSSDIARRFRAGMMPGFVDGITSAITDPDNAVQGFRVSLASLFDGLGALLEPLSESSSGGDRSGG